jgi:hypothetical protein
MRIFVLKRTESRRVTRHPAEALAGIDGPKALHRPLYGP